MHSSIDSTARSWPLNRLEHCTYVGAYHPEDKHPPRQGFEPITSEVLRPQVLTSVYRLTYVNNLFFPRIFGPNVISVMTLSATLGQQ